MAERSRILVVDDKLALAETLADGLLDRGYAARATGSSREALEAVTRGELDLLVTDLRMPGIDGLALVEASRAPALDIPVIVMTAYGAIDSAVESIRRGAYHYLTKPFKLDELVVFLERALAERTLRREAAALREAVREQFSIAGLVGASPAMQRVLAVVARVARTDAPMLITGETGTGKELIAREIHRRSPRKNGPFVAINCGAIPENLLESELFGHAKGAFTGAVTARPGRFQAANGGTLLLDEIGEMPVGLQVKLLRALQDRAVTKVGENKPEPVDIRVVAATNKDLEEEMKHGRFREDLFYRINVVHLHLPPLRERGEDAVTLAKYFLKRASRELNVKARDFNKAALNALRHFRWPGNIRQLENRIKKAVVMADGPYITPEDLDVKQEQLEPILPLAVAQEQWKERYIDEALERNGGNRTKTAKDLDVDPRTIFRHLRAKAEKSGEALPEELGEGET